MFNEAVNVHYIFDAHKPSRTNYRKAMELMGTDTTNTIFVGDQLFTDVWGAKRTGIRNILVQPIHPKEEIQIVIKRVLEKVVLFFYKHRKNRE
jgi:HAD superfamily phosphatase (TIGR01668 family)